MEAWLLTFFVIDFRVKLGIDISTKKEVAIKILRTKQMLEMKECVDCLFTEINILTECRHPNVVKILDASFEGTIVKEKLVQKDDQFNEEEYCDELEDEEQQEQIHQKKQKRKQGTSDKF